jgi:serine/threonine-protein kinase
MKAMAKSPDRRYGTAEELRADLLRFTEGLPVLAGDPAATSVQAAVGATVAVGAVAAGAATTTAQPRIRPQHVDDVPEEDDEEAARRRTKRLWIILGVLLLALAVVGILLARTLGASSTFAMPNVVGQTVASATTTLEDKGLTIGATHRSHSSQPVNTVINSDPSSGTEVKKGQAVTLTVSSGQQAAQVLVPNVVGQQLTDAATILNGVNLGYSVKPEQSSKPSGQVLAQNPVAGSTAGAGTDVVLTVSTQTTTTVPNVVGQNQTTAGSMLAQNNLTVGNVTNQCSTSNVASGLVVSSNPGAGTTLPPQSPVALVVSTGPCQVVPPVVGLTPAAATTTLAAQTPSLTAVPVNTINCTSAQNGTVVNTNPAVGAQVGSSLSVTIYVCNLSGTTTTTTTSPGTSSTTSTSSTSTTTTSTAPPG